MDTALIVFASSVWGSRLKTLASNARIGDVRITQTPNSIKSAGCSYSLRVNMHDLDDILKLAARYNVRFTAVYKEEYDIAGTIVYKKL